ncbi:MAG: peptidoglycan-binding domain-containing protein [Planctomycetota bacterium]|jgi:hypothetical protein
MSYTGVSGPFGSTGFGGVQDVNTGINCGDVRGTQEMLRELGFFHYAIDGKMDQYTQASLVAYALSKGMQHDPSKPPSGAICAALIADYTASKGLPPTPPTAEQCPKGTHGMPPYCVAVPGTTPPAPPGATACPSGQVGTPPNCYAVPGLPGTLPTTPPGVPPKPVPPKPVPPPPPPPPAPAGFWAQRSDTEKLVMVAGAGLGVLLLVGLAAGGRKRQTARLTPNRRRRRKRRRARANRASPKKSKSRRRKAAKSYPKGKAIVLRKSKTGRTLKKGKRWGRLQPAKKYRRRGMVRKSQYAWPDGYMYPVASKKFCKAAASRFGQNKKRYPMHVRRTIAKNINKCKKRFGIGGPPIKP